MSLREEGGALFAPGAHPQDGHIYERSPPMDTLHSGFSAIKYREVA